MDQQMEEVNEKVCVFEDSLEIDFDYEFDDVAKFFDFLRPESPEEIEESEFWFHVAPGHPPSPLIVRLDLATKELGVSEASKYEQNVNSIKSDGGHPGVFSPGKRNKGSGMLQSKSKSKSMSCLSKSSRLLQPTESQLAKQNQQIGGNAKRAPARLQKLGSPLKSPGDVPSTKRQKLEIGYLRKVSHLKHQTTFSHKLPKKVGTSNVNSSNGRPKVTVPKEPDLETANRAQRHRSKNAADPSSVSKHDVCSSGPRLDKKVSNYMKKSIQPMAHEFQAACICGAKIPVQTGILNNKRTNCVNVSRQQESSDQVYRFKALPLKRKIFSSTGDLGVSRNSKREATVPKEFKLSTSKKLSPKLPIELFSKLSLNSENHNGASLAKEKLLQAKGLKRSVSCSVMKENKNSNKATANQLCVA